MKKQTLKTVIFYVAIAIASLLILENHVMPDWIKRFLGIVLLVGIVVTTFFTVRSMISGNEKQNKD
ncbi:MAG: hypothetical protein KBT45_02620 [Bacteroidales bacterium]|nr:hypothetical protein [Candidatus Colimorpha pelethequi]